MALPTLNTFTANTKIESSKVNENFTNLRNRTEVSSSTDHIVITAGTSKLVKITVLRQDNTTDTYTANTVILTGWGWILPSGSGQYENEAITYGITFSERPVVLASNVGYKEGSNPSHIGDTGGYIANADFEAYGSATTGFSVGLAGRSVDGGSPGNLVSTRRYMYGWIAIGALA